MSSVIRGPLCNHNKLEQNLSPKKKKQKGFLHVSFSKEREYINNERLN